MAEIKNKEDMGQTPFAIPVKNNIYLIAGFGVMVLGYLLMMGGGPDSPDVFNPGMFSFRRIVLAPVVILAGIAIEIVAIMYRGKSKK